MDVCAHSAGAARRGLGGDLSNGTVPQRWPMGYPAYRDGFPPEPTVNCVAAALAGAGHIVTPSALSPVCFT